MLRGRRGLSVFFTALFLLSSIPIIGAQDTEESYVRAESLVVVVHDNVSHDSAAYTQGLEFHQGRLFESTGLYGNSTLREVNLSSGSVIRSVDLNASEFGEGMTFVGDEIIQLTWQEGIAYRYEMETFDIVANYAYEGEGWGLVYDGHQLVMSNRTDVLTLRNASTFEIEGTLNVTLNGEPLTKINEMEIWEGILLANIYQTEEIVGIDLNSGVAILHIDASGLRPQGAGVMNGIAFDSATQSLWITGKEWPMMYNITFIEPEAPSEPEPEVESPASTEDKLVYSNVVLAIMVAAVVILLAMNLKDGGPNPPDEGATE
jgi:glutamine cyclotransferase|tara:strand:- start:480 stop:1433 length:954 start_codon:yes stop_codon:yes gene_type:complete